MDNLMMSQDDLDDLITLQKPLQDLIDDVRRALLVGRKFIIEQRYENAPSEIIRVISTEKELIKWIEELIKSSAQDLK